MKLLGTLFALVAVAGLASAEEKKFDAAKLEGKWKITEGTKSGSKVEEANLKGEVIITKDSVTIKSPDMTHVMSYKLDTSKKPKEIDLTPESGNEAGQTMQGIYELDGDNLKLCFGRPGTGRPKEFSSKEGSEHALVVLKRAK